MKHLKYYSRDIVKFFLFCLLLIVTVFFAFSVNGEGTPGYNKLSIADSTALEELGEALFSDVRFSSPDGKFSGMKKDENSLFSISCKSCHLVDEKLDEKGMRGYTDFSARTPIPYRNGDKNLFQFTTRRTQQLINVAGSNIISADIYHWDGEFEQGSNHLSLIKLIEKTFISKNMGWRAGEEKKSDALRLKFILDECSPVAGSSDKEQLTYIEQYCKSFGITREAFFKLSGEEILLYCNEAIAFYIENIKSDIESPFDLFLKENGIEIPSEADENMLNTFLKREDLKYINKTIPVPNSEIVSSRKVKFGKKELAGLRLFMNKEKTNCSSCHTPPSFTDNKYYNIGVSEFDYKNVHGKYPGEFYGQENILADLSNGDIPVLKEQYQVYPDKANPEDIDLGRGVFVKIADNFGAFRTPSLRNLKYSNPYLHSGSAETIEEAVTHHIKASNSREYLRFISAKLSQINLSRGEIGYLTAFIKSLNDHYE